MALEFIFEPSNQFIITFLFTLAVVFGALDLVNVFKNRAVSAVIAAAIAFFAASYNPFVTTLWFYLPNITWFFIVIFFIAFFLELFGLRRPRGEAYKESIVIQGAILFILLSVGWMVIEQFPFEIPYIGGGQNVILFFGIILILAIFWSAFKLKPEQVQAQQKEGG